MGPIEMVVAGFDRYGTADDVMGELRAMDQADELNVLNLIVLRKDTAGNVTATDDGDVKPGNGALFGAFVGALIGLIAGPGGAVVGAAAGAITGGITAANINLGFSEETLEALKVILPPNRSAILALVEAEELAQLTDEIRKRGGRIIHTAVREDFLNRLRKDDNKDWEKF